MASKKAKGKRAKTRRLFKRKTSKPTVNTLLQEFNVGDKVVIKVNPSIHSGMPFRRFHGKTGVVKRLQGKCYVVEVMDGNLKKNVIVGAAHLKA
jgi:large subunit ribosomal protein L21e